MTIELCDPGTQQATPRPVPGPSTAIGAPDMASPPPSGYKSAAVRCGNDNAVASKSLKRWTFAKPNAAHSSGASIVHGQLVSTQRSLSTGPATASNASGTDGVHKSRELSYGKRVDRTKNSIRQKCQSSVRGANIAQQHVLM